MNNPRLIGSSGATKSGSTIFCSEPGSSVTANCKGEVLLGFCVPAGRFAAAPEAGQQGPAPCAHGASSLACGGSVKDTDTGMRWGAVR